MNVKQASKKQLKSAKDYARDGLRISLIKEPSERMVAKVAAKVLRAIPKPKKTYTYLVELSYRHHGCHDLKNSTTIKSKTLLYRHFKKEDNFDVKEELLLTLLPDNFLPQEPANILLMIGDESYAYSTAVSHPEKFRAWGKYFDSYSLTISKVKPKKK